jgi:hypothetical protein
MSPAGGDEGRYVTALAATSNAGRQLATETAEVIFAGVHLHRPAILRRREVADKESPKWT